MPIDVIDPSTLRPDAFAGRTVAILGYGNQGRAQALNLRDSGIRVVVGNRAGSERAARAAADGFDVFGPAEATRRADAVLLLTPDDTHAALVAGELAQALSPGKALGFAHGYSVVFGGLRAPEGVDVILVAPKGIGVQVRAQYEAGNGIPMLVAVERDATGRALETALALSVGVGRGTAGLYRTTFREETETDLFGEQAVLCGGVPELMRAAFDTLVEAGYPPELAYFECLHELKLIVDVAYAHGLAALSARISPTADFGGATRGPRIVTDATRAELRAMLEEIRSGAFAFELSREMAGGSPVLRAHRARLAAHASEPAGASVRARMTGIAR
jgi:ketol-acid reductoisomerase